MMSSCRDQHLRDNEYPQQFQRSIPSHDSQLCNNIYFSLDAAKWNTKFVLNTQAYYCSDQVDIMKDHESYAAKKRRRTDRRH